MKLALTFEENEIASVDHDKLVVLWRLFEIFFGNAVEGNYNSGRHRKILSKNIVVDVKEVKCDMH